METRLSNIFKTTNITNFTQAILKSYKRSISYIQIENTKTTRLLFKGSWILLYFWHSNWHNFGYISGKVAKPHILESPQKSLKTRQHSYQHGHPLRNNDPLKTWKICFFGGSFFKIKIADILNFQWIKYLGKGLSYLENWGIGFYCCWNYGPSKLLLHFIKYRLDQLHKKHAKITVNWAIRYFEGRLKRNVC